ncbi:receptor-like protein EIX1 [Medicago truncatula]|uniref:receptor-like protein EIX1 n=1 Tax=Medicago truncatula TaxID=3880 RepID=UPI000D2F352C|nr:receptor-like protein EIX1 [Medicago truncatula]
MVAFHHGKVKSVANGKEFHVILKDCKCIGTLGQLIELNLGFNGLEGKIPKSVGSLGNLIELNLSGNKLVSVIPPGLGNLSNLQTLDLGFNDLTANDLEWISHLSNLRHLAVDRLSSISKTSSLSELHLLGCGLHQALPKSIPHLNSSISLKYLDLKENGLRSAIAHCAMESFHKNKCVETERRALLKFKDALLLERNDLTSWKGEECCKWEGISCDNFTHHVTSLDLFAFRLSGKLDSSICELKHLTSLNLAYNKLESKIPKCIGSLSKLIELNLIGNKLVSVIPPSLGNLSNLQTLDLGFNDLTANDLEWISHLSNLRHLGLSKVNLSLVVDWLSSISKIPSLSELDFYGCGLHQVNLESIPLLNTSISLKYLDLSYNEFQSSILKYFRNMSQLQELQLNYNKLSSKLSDNIQQLCSAKNGLRKLDLSDNPFIRGPLPDFSCFSSLEALSLRNANVVGTFL